MKQKLVRVIEYNINRIFKYQEKNLYRNLADISKSKDAKFDNIFVVLYK